MTVFSQTSRRHCAAPGCTRPVHGHGWCRGHYHQIVTLGQPAPPAPERPAPPMWMDLALCAEVDPDLFFPETGRNDVMRAAKRICAACPVIDDCLTFAFRIGADTGIFGGLTAEERRVLLQRPRGDAA
jgi:WhiB family transcriptional regulator, redox-sensing transcriptional regulator